MNLRPIKPTLLLLFVWVFSLNSFAQTVSEEDEYIGIKTSVFSTPEDLPIESILSQDFEPADRGVLNLGASDNYHYVQFDVLFDEDKHTNINIGYPIIDHVVLYRKTADGLEILGEQGQAYPFSARTSESVNFVFPIEAKADQTETYILKVKSTKQILLPISLNSTDNINQQALTQHLIGGLYLGILMVMFIYNLFIFFSSKDSSYLYYSIYIVTLAFTQASLNGYFDKYLWPGNVYLSQFSVQIWGSLVGISSLVFIQKFLHTKTILPKAHKMLLVFIAVDCVAFVLSVAGMGTIAYNVINLIALLGSVSGIVIAIIAYKKGVKSARFFLLGWGLFLTSIIIFILKDVNLVPYNQFTINVVLIGSAAEVVLLSFALADKINTFRKQMETSQKKALEASQLNEKLIKEQNIVLEARVKERTSELEEANANLTSALGSLKEAQSQLVEAEKMASLGQLTAGIAHEINNPINFVSSNVKPIQQDIADIFSLVEDVQAFMEEKNYSEGLDFLKDKKESYDYTFLQDELSMLVTGLKDGADRTIEIVRGLKTFSRLDESDLKKVNLIEGLESTLILLRNKYKDAINIEKDYEQIPEVECLGGKMNQVFMNIITNGIQALTEHPEIADPTLFISTKQLGDFVLISVKDNGPGIPKEVKERIFEPFFTTKPVGQGTGLGLSIVYKIIESHGGTLDVVSEPGQGAEFRITLPIENNNNL
ncbi:MAG: 7TM diverse intracellular signaling domain-containing protein [Schleiferiaceae bacterium]